MRRAFATLLALGTLAHALGTLAHASGDVVVFQMGTSRGKIEAVMAEAGAPWFQQWLVDQELIGAVMDQGFTNFVLMAVDTAKGEAIAAAEVIAGATGTVVRAAAVADILNLIGPRTNVWDAAAASVSTNSAKWDTAASQAGDWGDHKAEVLGHTGSDHGVASGGGFYAGVTARLEGVYKSGVAVGGGSQAGDTSVAVGAIAAAVGEDAVAVGPNAAALQGGIAIGCRALVSAFDAVQIGEGDNTDQGTLQFRNYPLVNAVGKIPTNRLTLHTDDATAHADIRNSIGPAVTAGVGAHAAALASTEAPGHVQLGSGLYAADGKVHTIVGSYISVPAEPAMTWDAGAAAAFHINTPLAANATFVTITNMVVGIPYTLTVKTGAQARGFSFTVADANMRALAGSMSTLTIPANSALVVTLQADGTGDVFYSTGPAE